MRILHVLNHTMHMNGHVHSTVDVACAQSALGHEVIVCSGGGDFDALLEEHGVSTVTLKQERKPTKLPLAFARMASVVLRTKPDVVHAHMMTSAVLAWPACKIASVPLVTTVHNAFEGSSILMGLGTRVIAVSQAIAGTMRKRGIPGGRIRVVLNGTIGTARLRGVPEAMRLQRPAVVFVGGLHPRKGLDELIEAFVTVHRRVPSARLHILGNGPHRDEYVASVASAGLEGVVRFEGHLRDPRPFLMGADVFVLPSRADPAPLVISEAREAGCAIVATAVDGIPELLEGGEAGMLVPPRDPTRLADALVSLLEDPGVLAEWRTRSQVGIERMHVARVARDVVGVYAECVKVPGRVGATARPHVLR